MAAALNAAAHAANAHAKPHTTPTTTTTAPVEPPAAPSDFPAIHHGVECDMSGQCPIVGNRYKLKGKNYDLCEAEFAKVG